MPTRSKNRSLTWWNGSLEDRTRPYLPPYTFTSNWKHAMMHVSQRIVEMRNGIFTFPALCDECKHMGTGLGYHLHWNHCFRTKNEHLELKSYMVQRYEERLLDARTDNHPDAVDVMKLCFDHITCTTGFSELDQGGRLQRQSRAIAYRGSGPCLRFVHS